MLYDIGAGTEVSPVKKALSKETLEKEAAWWNAVKELAKQNPGNICRK